MNISTQPISGGVIRLCVAGEIDMANVGRLDAALADVVTHSDVVKVVIDFAAVTFCDSSGVAALDRGYAAAGERDVGFQLINLRPDVRRVLEITGVLEGLTGSGG